MKGLEPGDQWHGSGGTTVAFIRGAGTVRARQGVLCSWKQRSEPRALFEDGGWGHKPRKTGGH